MKIRINCDMGEGMENEAKFMAYIDSCSVACGGHYGNYETVDRTIKQAIQHNVKIGAHPSFADLQGFGRRELSYPYDLLVRSLTDQLRLFLLVAEQNNINIDHVKPHGALYNLAMKNSFHVDAICAAMKNLALRCPLYGNGHFFVDRAFAQNKIPVLKEIFIDRQYRSDGSLVPKAEPQAIITNPDQAWNQILGVSQNNTLQSIDGKTLIVQADTFCIHVDNPQALALLEHISNKMNEL